MTHLAQTQELYISHRIKFTSSSALIIITLPFNEKLFS